MQFCTNFEIFEELYIFCDFTLVDCGKSPTLHVKTVLYSFSDLHVSSNLIGSQYILAIVDRYWLPKELIMPIQTKLNGQSKLIFPDVN